MASGSPAPNTSFCNSAVSQWGGMGEGCVSGVTRGWCRAIFSSAPRQASRSFALHEQSHHSVTMPQTLDFIYIHDLYSVPICRLCRSCFPTSISRHIRLHHNNPKRSKAELDAYQALFPTLGANLSAPQIRLLQPARGIPPIDGLKLHHDGILCRLYDESDRPYICRTWTGMRAHLRKVHNHGPRSQGSNVAGTGGQRIAASITAGYIRMPVACQSFFSSTGHTRFFEVSPRGPMKGGSARVTEAADSEDGPSLSLREQIELELAEVSDEDQAAPGGSDFASMPAATSEQSRWLQLTEWARFLAGHSLPAAARLIDFPVGYGSGLKTQPASYGDRGALPSLPTFDPVLHHILDAFDRVIQRARQSLASGKLNAFDQHRLNSFLANRTARKPLLHLLQEESYRKYVRVFQRLLCYAYRRAWVKEGPELSFRATDEQLLALTSMVHVAQDLDNAAREEHDQEYVEGLSQRLEDECLTFCITLLDHRLYGDLFDSLVIGFLAVLAIQVPQDGSRPRLCEAIKYTPHLSALIKISQLLVAEYSVLAVQQDKADYPATVLEEMQRRFIVEGTRSPVCWALKLRAYGKAIKDTTTSIGHIAWSDDNETLMYKDSRLTMAGLRQLVQTELEMTRDQLAELLLVHPDEDREAVVPFISLRSLLDNPSESTPGWSFIQHKDNTVLHKHEKWLLSRVLDNDWLRKDFFHHHAGAKWRHDIIRRYLADVDSFLERLLSLVHITGGQPARGTELLSIQYCNPFDGQGRRNIFLENGLVSFVTFYHKGYSTTGSTKIIHCYLPVEVSELLVYYIWLVESFVRQVTKLAKIPGLKMSAIPYLWGGLIAGEKSVSKTKQLLIKTKTPIRDDNPWPSTRLSKVLTREFQHLAQTKFDIRTWRHAAITISRRHLHQAKFKRDFIEAAAWAWNDEMAAHSTKMAGLTYARGLDEAPGHMAGAKTEYRRISREWHAWLGFGGYRTTKPDRAGPANPLGEDISGQINGRLGQKRSAMPNVEAGDGRDAYYPKRQKKI